MTLKDVLEMLPDNSLVKLYNDSNMSFLEKGKACEMKKCEYSNNHIFCMFPGHDYKERDYLLIFVEVN